jgi:2-dehydropantoate 2-reductase
MIGKNTKILVVGAGAIGGISAGLLARAGRDVEIVDRNRDLVEKVRANGLHVFGARGDFRVKVPAFPDLRQIAGKRDLVLLATKGTALPAVAEELLPVLDDGSAVVSLQNGICEEVIASVIGPQRTVGCVVGWGATMHAAGELEMTSRGELIIGRLDGRADPTLESVRDVLQAIVPVKISANIMGHLYAKLVINSCITTLGAITGLYLGEMLKSAKARVIFIEIIREAMDVAKAMDLNVEPVGNLDLVSFVEGRGFIANFKRHFIIRLIGRKFRKLKSSSLQSLERGERTEVDGFNGYIARKGQEKGVPTPLNGFLTRMVKDIETGTRRISPANFDDPFFERYAT